MSSSTYPVTEEISSQAPSLPDTDVEHGLPGGWGEGLKGKILFGIAIAFSVFQLATAVYAILPSQVLRTVHVGFLVLVASALIANHRSRSSLSLAIGWGMGIVGFLVGLYHWIFYNDLVNRAGELLTMDLVTGIVGLVVLFIVAWRMMGPALPLICLAFLAYALFGNYLPAPLDHRGYTLDQVVEQMAFGTEGIYGTPVAVSATYIFLFILFGSFLERAGMIQLFNDVAMGLFGSSKGGPAKVAVFSSALMGTISGSGVANVVTTGQFTIPLMKRFGYKPAFAGGVEATASMGGQIMPPVMGAVAFIMAENIGVPYTEIVKAAIIPALLYFGSAFWMVHLEAGKEGLVGMSRSELPRPLEAFIRQWHLALPLIVLIILLFAGFTPLFSGAVGLALTAILIIGNAIASAIGPEPDLAVGVIIDLIEDVRRGARRRDIGRTGHALGPLLQILERKGGRCSHLQTLLRHGRGGKALSGQGGRGGGCLEKLAAVEHGTTHILIVERRTPTDQGGRIETLLAS